MPLLSVLPATRNGVPISKRTANLPTVTSAEAAAGICRRVPGGRLERLRSSPRHDNELPEKQHFKRRKQTVSDYHT